MGDAPTGHLGTMLKTDNFNCMIGADAISVSSHFIQRRSTRNSVIKTMVTPSFWKVGRQKWLLGGELRGELRGEGRGELRGNCRGIAGNRG